MNSQSAPVETILHTSAAPWDSGTIIWLPAAHTAASSYLHWARYPLWAEMPDREFPLSVWQGLPPDLAEQLGKNYHLADEDDNDKPTALLTTDGLKINELLVDWQTIAPYWPALVYQAADISAKPYSSLRAMAIWLGKLPLEQVLPVYIPPTHLNKQPPLTARALEQDWPVNVLRSAAICRLNRHEQSRQQHQTSLFRRKLRKLWRDPKQFWLDSRLRKQFVK